MNGRNFAVAALFIGLAGCAHPLVKLDPLVTQSKVEDVADWDALANRQAEKFAVALGVAPYNERVSAPAVVLDAQSAGRPKGVRPFHIVAGSSDFASAFKPLLEKHLLEHGYAVSQSNEGSWEIRIDTQTFLYDREGRNKSPVQYATFWTSAYALGVLARNVSQIDTGAAIAAAAGPLVDTLAYMNDITNAEVLLVLTMADSVRVSYRGTEEFYVHPSDLPRYWDDRPANLMLVDLPVRRAPLNLRSGQ